MLIQNEWKWRMKLKKDVLISITNSKIKSLQKSLNISPPPLCGPRQVSNQKFCLKEIEIFNISDFLSVNLRLRPSKSSFPIPSWGYVLTYWSAGVAALEATCGHWPRSLAYGWSRQGQQTVSTEILILKEPNMCTLHICYDDDMKKQILLYGRRCLYGVQDMKRFSSTRRTRSMLLRHYLTTLVFPARTRT